MKKILMPIVAVGAAGAIAALLILNRPAPEVTPAEERVTLVTTQVAKSHDLVMVVESQGSVAPRTETTMVSEVSGRVVSVSDKFFVGGFFEEGELLLALDDADYQVNVQQARSSLLTAEAQLVQEEAQAEQARRQWQSNGRALADAPPLALRVPFLEEAKARVLYAEAELARAQRQLERTKIRAPYDGLIREKLVDIGQYVSTGTQVARTFAVDYAEVRLPLTDRDLAYLNLPRPGLSLDEMDNSQDEVTSLVELSTDVGGKPYKWQGKIVRTDGVIDTSSRVHYAVAQVADPYGLRQSIKRPVLAIGSFVSAEIQGITARDVYTVPINAVRNGNELLVMDSESKLRQRTVSILRMGAEEVHIDGGLSDGEHIIVSPVPVPIEGMRVRSTNLSGNELSSVGALQ
ncbi:MAG: efflux RND transporter periplasmic adaptor subunit [Pseudohongiellaceae bacterium]|nr:efflux RND transporter periplasmic adaptor subunit [Pseudohongiellaceae bacterium]